MFGTCRSPERQRPKESLYKSKYPGEVQVSTARSAGEETKGERDKN
jgi:hypothetical protein